MACGTSGSRVASSNRQAEPPKEPFSPRFAEDIEAGLRWLEDARGIDPREVVLVGHSVGAGAALFAATRTRVAGVVAVSCMAHPAELMTALMRRAHLPRALIRYLLWRTEGVTGLRFDDFAPKATIARVDAPVLIVHGALMGVHEIHLQPRVIDEAGVRAASR